MIARIITLDQDTYNLLMAKSRVCDKLREHQQTGNGETELDRALADLAKMEKSR